MSRSVWTQVNVNIDQVLVHVRSTMIRQLYVIKLSLRPIIGSIWSIQRLDFSSISLCSSVIFFEMVLDTYRKKYTPISLIKGITIVFLLSRLVVVALWTVSSSQKTTRYAHQCNRYDHSDLGLVSCFKSSQSRRQESLDEENTSYSLHRNWSGWSHSTWLPWLWSHSWQKQEFSSFWQWLFFPSSWSWQSLPRSSP